MLYHADRLGYMVWGEYGNWGLDIFRTEGLARFLPEWMEALARDFNHPSIIGWCPFNETFDVPFEAPRRAQEDAVLRNGFAVTKALDPTRPVLDTSSFHHVINTSQELMMIAFGSCVSTILLSLFRYNIKKTSDGVSAEVNVTIREEHPKVLQHILLFLIHSKDLTKEEVRMALQIAEDTLCLVWSMIKGCVTVKVKTEIDSSFLTEYI